MRGRLIGTLPGARANPPPSNEKGGGTTVPLGDNYPPPRETPDPIGVPPF